jgi:hypothetical protein
VGGTTAPKTARRGTGLWQIGDFEEGCGGSLDGGEGGWGGALGVEDIGEGFDGGCAEFGGLDAGAGVGCAFDEG